MKSAPVLLLFLWLLSTPVALAAPAVPEAFIESYAKQHQLSGTILIQRGGKVEYTRSFGLASIELQVPNTDHTKYKIASITKAFTATLILQLRDAGRLDLRAPIQRYLPSYRGPGAHKVTVHQLLNHTSGLDNIDKVKSAEDAIKHGLPVYQTPYTSDELIARFCSGPLVHAPGTVFDYNNADYLVLGKIIEQLHGKPYAQVLQERILDPLRLTSTGMVAQHAIIASLAETYFVREDLKHLVPDLPVYPENWYAAGAMYSTVNDLRPFANALVGARLTTRASLELLIKPGLDDYGYGVWSYETKVGARKYRVVKRPGRIMGAQGQLYHVMAPDITIIILSNTGSADLDELVAEIGKKLLG
jgi:D-alanyl-D-alanine carboxypeptidase